MLHTEGQWSEALASNNIRAIICWLRTLTAEGELDGEETLLSFSCWVQRTSEFAKKELITLCFSRCQGLWMFLDRNSFSRVHSLLQRLRNLLTLAQWARRQLGSAHLWHGVGVPCTVCRDTFSSSDVRRDCWNRERRALKQHIWLGQLVQWWGVMGLLPKYPEAHEMKRIAQMWKEIGHSHRKACLQTPGSTRLEEGDTGGFSSLVQGMVTQLDKRHGCLWISEEGKDRCYPPPDLQALLKLVLIPHVDNMSVQALLMYFVLDTANFLQCKDDLLQSFCHAFTIPDTFSRQVKAFWLLDHGHVKASMELLLSPRAAAPRLSWQHRCIIRCLLLRKQPRLALLYLHWTGPAVESVEDAKLCADVLLQNSCVAEAWDLVKKGHTESNDVAVHFFKACSRYGLCAEALKYIPAGYNVESETTGCHLQQMREGNPPYPLSAALYQAQKVKVTPDGVVQLIREAVMGIRNPHPKISEVVWPEHTERKPNSGELFLSTQTLCYLTPCPSPVAASEEAAHSNDPDTEPLFQNQLQSPENISSSYEDMSSASSLPLRKWDHPYVYKSTLTLQRISSLLSEESQSQKEEDSRSSSSIEALPGCPELTLTLDGATYPISLSSLNKGAFVAVVLSEGSEEGAMNEEVFSVDAESTQDQSASTVCAPHGY